MRIIILKRIAMTDKGTFGVLITGGFPFALTLEREWKNNRRGLSCIPQGQYECARVTSPKFGETFQVENVPGRTHILFHTGNLEDDSHGCILVGEQFEKLNGIPAILASRKGFKEFMRKLEGEDIFRLVILNQW